MIYKAKTSPATIDKKARGVLYIVIKNIRKRVLKSESIIQNTKKYTIGFEVKDANGNILNRVKIAKIAATNIYKLKIRRIDIAKILASIVKLVTVFSLLCSFKEHKE